MQYEIHITVKTKDIELFRSDCALIGVKPIIIETQNNSGFEQQVMTSSKYTGGNYLEQLNYLCKHISTLKYDVLRSKVEIRPQKAKHTNFLYYESHLRLKLPSQGFNKQLLIDLCNDYKWHLSKNLFKKDEFHEYQMLTYRTEVLPLDVFRNQIDLMVNELYQLHYLLNIDKIEVEECIYDSNPLIDKNWLN